MPPRVVDACDDVLGRRAFPRDERRAARATATSRTPRSMICDVPAATSARAIHGRPTDVGRIVERRPAGSRRRRGAMPCAGEPSDHVANAIDALLRAASTRNACSAGRSRIDEIAEHVDVGLVADRGDLDAGDELDAGGRARGGGRVAAGHGVVVGDAQHGDAGRRRARDQLRRRAAAVGRGRVGVEIDQRRDATAARTLGLARRRARRWPLALSRSRSARYSRISRSRCARSSSANSRKICLPSESSNRSP